jgi:hypothetical protein
MFASGATHAFSRRLLSRASRPFIGPMSREALGRFGQFAKTSANGWYLRIAVVAVTAASRD